MAAVRQAAAPSSGRGGVRATHPRVSRAQKSPSSRRIGLSVAQSRRYCCINRNTPYNASMGTIGERLKAARESAGLTLRELADRVPDLDYSAISRIETGKRRVVSHELYNLADGLGTTTGQLLGVPRRSRALTVAARLGAATHPDYLDSAVERMNQVLEMDDLLTRVAGPASSPAPIEVNHRGTGPAWIQGRKLAGDARSALNLGAGPVPEMSSLLEERIGAHVVAQPIDGEVHGLCAADDGVAVVLVNTNDIWTRQRFTLAHELAHLLCQDLQLYEITETTERPETHEKRADAFAAYFLGPDEGILAFVDERQITGAVVAELMDYFGMSLDAMCWRLVSLKLLTKEEAASFKVSGLRGVLAAADLKGTFQSRVLKSENVKVPPTKLLRRALAAYQHGEVGVGVVSAVLGETDANEVRRWMEDKGVTAPEVGSSLDGASLV
jgi:Zn-dependent peptidase ImmA (M78 family)/transcriptional regulator with XRE-family HTH domain